MALTPFTSKLIADVGISFGDEGKGRLIAEVVRELQATTDRRDIAGMVLKVNGGANSGHTAGGLKLNLLPAGVIEGDVATLAIGGGVVADPRKFWWEIKPVEAKGFRVFDRLLIDERTMVSDLCHRLLDLGGEFYRAEILGQEPRGSTGRGITPAYMDETGQVQMGYSLFLGERAAFAEILARRADRACRTIRHVYQASEEAWNGFFDTLTQAETRANAEALEMGLFDREEFDFTRFKGKAPFTLNLEELTEVYWQAGTALKARIGDVREGVLQCLRESRYVLGEFGQSYWLDKRHGFPPNVTASHTYSPEMFQSAGIPCQPIHTLGCCKAYDTKVGTHTFLTQMPEGHPLTVFLKKLEFGTSTGRQRMVGWCDCVEKGDALRYGGFEDLVINKLDALGYRDDWQGGELLLCTAYRASDGKLVRGVPRDEAFRKTLQPVYQQLPGWEEDISAVRSFAELPENARRYIAAMMKATLEVAYRDGGWPRTLPNLRYIGVGPDPEQIITDVPATAELLKLAP